MLQTVIFLLATTGSLTWRQAPADHLQAEIDQADTESRELAEELAGLLEVLEMVQVNKKVTLAENIYTDIVLRIQQIAGATEQENLIKLSETVKAKRMEEEELREYKDQLQHLLRSQLEIKGEI